MSDPGRMLTGLHSPDTMLRSQSEKRCQRRATNGALRTTSGGIAHLSNWASGMHMAACEPAGVTALGSVA